MARALPRWKNEKEIENEGLGRQAASIGVVSVAQGRCYNKNDEPFNYKMERWGKECIYAKHA